MKNIISALVLAALSASAVEALDLVGAFTNLATDYKELPATDKQARDAIQDSLKVIYGRLKAAGQEDAVEPTFEDIGWDKGVPARFTPQIDTALAALDNAGDTRAMDVKAGAAADAIANAYVRTLTGPVKTKVQAQLAK